MKKLMVFCLLCLIFASCTTPWSQKPTSEFYETDKFFYNIDLRIVSINGDCTITNDEQHKPQTCNIILFETIFTDRVKLYREINTCKMNTGIHINTGWLYNHKVGDIVHFDYLRKDSFFEIKNRN